ncbi:HAUS augmin-like complex subunit 1 [Quillaja saponaria]|uniref:HAUS augmin-like complex subunit 1 n=1 Tax=Quillaja saponaria TaxID=32244 RepID=A0AAD7VI13_QUISA|nr:HAUS augmin-like complex subunit 1 [Quillaja saponaria]
MDEHRKDLEKKTKPILDTLRSYQDLPPDKALAALAIEDKKGSLLLRRSILKMYCTQLLPLRINAPLDKLSNVRSLLAS